MQGTRDQQPQLADPVAEASRILDAASGRNLTLRAAGGVGVAILCPSARHPSLQRQYHDIDLVCRGGEQHLVETLFELLGYVPDKEFNALHGQDRMFFHDPVNDREVDIFVERIFGAHELNLRNRLHLSTRALTPADLLLSKLQVYHTNNKDLLDIVALLTDQPLTDDDTGINMQRVVDVCSGDWGWWRTVTVVADRTHTFIQTHELVDRQDVEDKLNTLRSTLETSPKSRKWKFRARIGDRVRWYEVPEEIQH
jgi:hypothetical protein